MKRKLGTAIEESVIHGAKVLAATQGRSLQEVIEDALEEYVKRHGRAGPGVIDSGRGVMPVDRALVDQVLREETWLDS